MAENPTQGKARGNRPPVLRGALLATLGAACAMFALIAATQQAQIGNLGREIDALRTAAAARKPPASLLADALPVELEPTRIVDAAQLEILMWDGTGVLVAEDLPDPGGPQVWRVWAMVGSDRWEHLADLDQAGTLAAGLGDIPDGATGFLVSREPSRLRPRSPTGPQAAIGTIEG